jgi:hypothetical protein
VHMEMDGSAESMLLDIVECAHSHIGPNLAAIVCNTGHTAPVTCHTVPVTGAVYKGTGVYRGVA